MSLATQVSALATRVGTEVKSLWAAVNAKAPSASPTFTGTVTLPSTTSVGNVSSTELGYLDGVTSAIQTQLNGKSATSHNHAGVYQPTDADLTAIAALVGTGILKRTGDGTWALDTSTFLTGNQTITLSGDATGSGTTAITVTVSDDSHAHTGATISALDAGDTTTGTFAIARIPTGTTSTTVALGDHAHAGVYQPVDADLTAIAALAGTTGLLKKTAANTWTLDTSAYITGNQSITLSGDVSGSGTTAITVTVTDDSHAHTGATISGLDAGDTTTGTFAIARIPTGTTGTTVALGNHTHSLPALTWGDIKNGKTIS